MDVPGAFLLPVYDLCGRMVNDLSIYKGREESADKVIIKTERPAYVK